MQLDLFAAGGTAPAPSPNPGSTPRAADIATFSDAALLAAIPEAGLPLVLCLIREAGRRRLQAAVPVLGRLCQLFAGFGIEREVPEQAVSLDALASIGGRQARSVVSELLNKHRVQGPTLKIAVRVAATLRCRLSAATLLPLLGHDDPEMRAIACGLAFALAEVNATLIELIADPEPNVRTSAACALGRLGRPEARAFLKNALRRAPTTAVIEAVVAIADHECVVLLARLARARTDLTGTARKALDSIETPFATSLADQLRYGTDAEDDDEDPPIDGLHR